MLTDMGSFSPLSAFALRAAAGVMQMQLGQPTTKSPALYGSRGPWPGFPDVQHHSTAQNMLSQDDSRDTQHGKQMRAPRRTKSITTARIRQIRP